MWPAETAGRLRRLTAAEVRLLLEALALVTLACAVTRLIPARRLMSTIERTPRLRSADRAAEPEAVLLAVGRAAARHPLRPRCLERALAGRWMLARRGHRSTLVIGARGSGFQAHAWLELEAAQPRDAQAAGYAPVWRSPA